MVICDNDTTLIFLATHSICTIAILSFAQPCNVNIRSNSKRNI